GAGTLAHPPETAVPRSSMPDPVEMRRVRYDLSTPTETKDRLAASLRARGRHEDAVLLYDGRADHPDVQQDVDWAVEHGASFVLLNLERMGRTVDDATGRACAVAAER